jgi:SET domain-containing protein
LIRGLIQYADTDTVIGYGDRIGQMIMSGPAFKWCPRFAHNKYKTFVFKRCCCRSSDIFFHQLKNLFLLTQILWRSSTVRSPRWLRNRGLRCRAAARASAAIAPQPADFETEALGREMFVYKYNHHRPYLWNVDNLH